MEQVERGARRNKVSLSSKFSMHLRNHRNDCRSSLNELLASPIASFMTFLVLGIALALPTGLHLILKNTQALTQDWDSTTKVSLFLKANTPSAKTQKLIADLALREDVASVNFIGADAALKEFQNSSGLGRAIAFLDENPLPDVLEITPSSAYNEPEKAQSMLAALREYPEVEVAQLDLEWVKRLHAMLAVAQRVTQMIALILGFAVLLIVGNTIRLSIHNKREEIEIIKLVGATDGFIQRPFLYSGFWYGIVGGFLAWLILTLALFSVEDAIGSLMNLYDSNFRLAYLSFSEFLYLLVIASCLGLIGSWASVARHLKLIQPR